MEIRSLGRYQIRAEIGRGTMGVVYRGYDPVLDRDIALKAVELPEGVSLERRKKFLDRFFLEAKIAGKLIHPNIVVTHDAATDEATGTPFIAMELLSGESLHGRLSEGRLSLEEALALVEPLARALDYAHQEGVVHRDIKPANVMLTAKGAPKITDFGIAKLPTAELTQTGTILGTPYFMSPEQLRGEEVDGRSDLFSLGVLLYNLLTGKPPFEGADLASVSQQVLYKSPAPASEGVREIPESVDRVLARAMHKKPAERYQSGSAFAEDIARVRRGESPLEGASFGEKTVESTPQRVEPPETRSGYGGAVVFVLMLAALATTAFVRREDVLRVLEPLREQREESTRRNAQEALAAEHLREGRGLMERGHFDEAAAAFARALSSSRDAKNGRGEAEALLWRGLLSAERGDWSRARADLESAGSVFEIYDVPGGKARALARQADLERDLGNYDVASSLYDAAGTHVDTRAGRAFLALMTGDLEAAERGFLSAGEGNYAGAVDVALGRPEQAEEHWGRTPDSELWRGYAARALSHEAEARRLFELAAARFRTQDHATGLAASLEGLEGLEEPGESGESVLQFLFRAEPRTPRNESRRKRLP